MYSIHGAVSSEEDAKNLIKVIEDTLLKAGYVLLDSSYRDDAYYSRYNVSIEYANSAEDAELKIETSEHKTREEAVLWCSDRRPNDFTRDFSYSIEEVGDVFKATVKTFLLASEWRKRKGN